MHKLGFTFGRDTGKGAVWGSTECPVESWARAGQSSSVQFSSVRFDSVRSVGWFNKHKMCQHCKIILSPSGANNSNGSSKMSRQASWRRESGDWWLGVNNNRLQSVALMCLFLCMTNFFLQFSNTLNAVVSFTGPDINSNSNNNNSSNSHNSNNCNCVACISLRIRNIILCVMRVNFQSLPQPNNNNILSMLHTDSLNRLLCQRCSVSICFM